MTDELKRDSIQIMSGEGLSRMKEEMSKSVFGTSLSDAWSKGICVNCREQALPKCYSDAGRAEYRISGLCEKCFDSICADDDYGPETGGDQ